MCNGFSSLLLYLLLLPSRRRAIEMKDVFGKKPKENGERDKETKENKEIIMARILSDNC